MKIQIEKNSEGRDELVIRVSVINPARPSSSGKVLLVASESGKTDLQINGKQVSMSLNAYIKP